ncbi:hypothetical protein FCM35_KLT15732 [Carex littledalei]|uniref:DUF7903 domain-containing protein n=1 Tax=Carex littledalei TaxID=544730 RepID=A0A833RIV6_9POAL|nr:hypothetical protein FCM35_KLT15732 [Carex littledalei]
MSYVPPHKRPSNRNPAPTPVPSSLNPKPFASPRHRHHQAPSFPRKIPYSPRLISRWYATSESLALVPYDSEAIERKNGSKPLTVNVTDEAGLLEEEERGVLRGIVEKVARDLIEAGQHAKEEIGSGDVKLLVMARVGKALFLGDPSVCLDSITKASTSEGGLNRLVRKTFYTRVSEEYIREVEELLVEKCGFKFVGAKERYHIKVIDKCQPDLIISCKCTASHDSGLELYKVEHNPLRHMVTDVSCLSKNFDLRIMLNTKRAVINLDADVANGINQLISAAVIDPEVKGGLRWPLGKESAADRFVIVGVWHTEHKILSRDKIRVDLRQADRFDYHSSTGEDVNDVSLKLSGLSELLTEDHFREGSIVDMIQEVVALIWGNLLSQSSTYNVDNSAGKALHIVLKRALFKDHKELINEFYQFLPEKYRGKDGTRFEDDTNILIKIKGNKPSTVLSVYTCPQLRSLPLARLHPPPCRLHCCLRATCSAASSAAWLLGAKALL